MSSGPGARRAHVDIYYTCAHILHVRTYTTHALLHVYYCTCTTACGTSHANKHCPWNLTICHWNLTVCYHACALQEQSKRSHTQLFANQIPTVPQVVVEGQLEAQQDQQVQSNPTPVVDMHAVQIQAAYTKSMYKDMEELKVQVALMTTQLRQLTAVTSALVANSASSKNSHEAVPPPVLEGAHELNGSSPTEVNEA